MWSRVAKLTASDGAVGDRFRWSGAVDGDTVVVSATRDDDNGPNSGSAYVFTKPASGGWVTATETAKLTPFDGAAADSFGRSVVVDGDAVVVGAYGDYDKGLSSGSAYVFTKPVGGWTSTSSGQVDRLRRERRRPVRTIGSGGWGHGGGGRPVR